jgi:hypothetical protein
MTVGRFRALYGWRLIGFDPPRKSSLFIILVRRRRVRRPRESAGSPSGNKGASIDKAHISRKLIFSGGLKNSDTSMLSSDAKPPFVTKYLAYGR